MRTFILLAFCVVSIALFGQRQKQFKGFFIRGNVSKIAQRVTAKETSDSAKVQAIHDWITNNIKYDIKKAKTANYRRDTTTRILRRRKAICLGYADLFNEMCKHSNIQSALVSGYVKTNDVDICDTFYLDEHAWNSVKIDGYWYMIDNTWDAGYVKEYILRWWSWLPAVVLGPWAKRYKYKPKFVFLPHQTYAIKSGTYFSYDHLPSMEMWQLMSPKITIEQWRTDSSFYYQKRKPDSPPIAISDGAQIAYSQMNQQDQRIYWGEPINEYNFRNHYETSASFYELGLKDYLELKEEESESIPAYKQAQATAQTSILHADSVLYYLQEQQDALVASNKAKRTEHKTYNRWYSKYNSRDVRISRIRMKQMNQKKRRYRKYRRQWGSKVRDAIQDDTYDSKEFKHMYDDVADSIKQELVLDSLFSMFYTRQDTLVQAISMIDSINQLVQSRLVNESSRLSAIEWHMYLLLVYRASGYDDNDYYIDLIKDQFPEVDSFLFVGNGSVKDTLNSYARYTSRLINQYRRDFRYATRAMRQLKRMQFANPELDSTRAKVLYAFDTTNSTASCWFYQLDCVFSQSYFNYINIYKAGVWAGLYTDAENKIFKPNKVIRNKIKNHKKATKSVRTIAKRLVRKNEREIRRLDRQRLKELERQQRALEEQK